MEWDENKVYLDRIGKESQDARRVGQKKNCKLSFLFEKKHEEKISFLEIFFLPKLILRWREIFRRLFKEKDNEIFFVFLSNVKHVKVLKLN